MRDVFKGWDGEFHKALRITDKFRRVWVEDRFGFTYEHVESPLAVTRFGDKGCWRWNSPYHSDTTDHFTAIAAMNAAGGEK